MTELTGVCPEHGLLTSADIDEDGNCCRPVYDEYAASVPCGFSCIGPGVDKVLRDLGDAFDRGRAVGREDIGKYSNAIGRIESALGVAGSVPMEQTISAVESLVRERDAFRAALAGVTSWYGCEDDGRGGCVSHQDSLRSCHHGVARKLLGWDK